jgi:hypothetical protein
MEDQMTFHHDGGISHYEDGLIGYIAMENSFNVIASANIFSDVSTVVFGFGVVLVYVVVMLGKIHKIENRVSYLNNGRVSDKPRRLSRHQRAQAHNSTHYRYQLSFMYWLCSKQNCILVLM